MTRDQMLERATHVFVGVIEKQELETWPFFRVPGENAKAWKPLRRAVRVEMVLRGSEAQSVVGIYEVFWTGGANGDWNLTYEGQRYLFLVRLDNGRYHVVRDWWRSIFEVGSGRHTRLPLDESRPLWERIALLMWWVQPDWSGALRDFWRNDPGRALGEWRAAKLLRGLLHHPDRNLRLFACEELLFYRTAQDECWDGLDSKDRSLLKTHHNAIQLANAWAENRRWEARAPEKWAEFLLPKSLSSENMAALRLFTTINNRRLRRHFCREFQRQFPWDNDHGCPADRPPPATVVTQDGDVPLVGGWPE